MKMKEFEPRGGGASLEPRWIRHCQMSSLRYPGYALDNVTVVC